LINFVQNMKIGIDLRPLTKEISGVKIYLTNLLPELFRLDHKNNYLLWWNSVEPFPLTKLSSRCKIINTNFSNRWLNLKFQFKKISIEKILQTNLDLFWLPDPRPIHIDKCKLVTTFHDLSPELFSQFFSIKTRIWHQFLNLPKLAQKSHKILTVSQATANDLQKFWQISTDKIQVTHLGVSKKLKPATPTEIAQVRKKYTLPKKFILSLSTLEPRKNLGLLVRALAELKKETDCPHELIFVGNTNSKIFAKTKIPRKNFVKFLGQIPEQEKSALISASSVLAFPSLYEGFGLPSLEALACGVPVLAAKIPACEEVAGSAAIFADPYNLDAWKIGLEKILTKKKVRQHLIKFGLKRAKNFTWKKCARETLKNFEY
jgi:glycosyltransferase involved in cell wall biosynthesis